MQSYSAADVVTFTVRENMVDGKGRKIILTLILHCFGHNNFTTRGRITWSEDREDPESI